MNGGNYNTINDKRQIQMEKPSFRVRDMVKRRLI